VICEPISLFLFCIPPKEASDNHASASHFEASSLFFAHGTIDCESSTVPNSSDGSDGGSVKIVLKEYKHKSPLSAHCQPTKSYFKEQPHPTARQIR